MCLWLYASLHITVFDSVIGWLYCQATDCMHVSGREAIEVLSPGILLTIMLPNCGQTKNFIPGSTPKLFVSDYQSICVAAGSVMHGCKWLDYLLYSRCYLPCPCPIARVRCMYLNYYSRLLHLSLQTYSMIGLLLSDSS